MSEIGDVLTHVCALAAQTTVAILSGLGLPCAIVGGMACRAYGRDRSPNDVDILVLPPASQKTITQEEIKKLLFAHAPPDCHYILAPARNPRATYRVLYFVLGPNPQPPDIAAAQIQSRTRPFFSLYRSSKVDILLPGVMHLPALPPQLIVWKRYHATSPANNELAPVNVELPLVPFSMLLLLKLQAWDDHRCASQAWYRNRAPKDVADLHWALGVAAGMIKDQQKGGQLWNNRQMFSEIFEFLSQVRVKDFCREFPEFRTVWRGLGFDVPAF